MADVSTVPNVKMMPLADITQDSALQMRLKIDKSTIDDYKKIIEEQGAMDPVIVFRYGDGAFLLSDGFQRLQAYAELKRKEIPVTIMRGTRSDALRYALKTNCRHGARVSNADKRHGCEMAVLDPTLAVLPDVDIANLIGVSSTLVGDVRRGENPKAKAERKREIRKKKAVADRHWSASAPMSAGHQETSAQQRQWP